MGARCHRPISAGGPKAFTVSDLQRGDQEGVIAEAFRPQEIHQPRLLPVERLDHVASSAHVMVMREGFIVHLLHMVRWVSAVYFLR